MSNYYTNEPDILELISLIKAHDIRRAVVSPGSTNISFAASLMYDKDIMVYSAVDERSAAYMACGLAAETGEPVIISCTGATAARNYVPALTEAYYRNLPILAVTSSQYFGRVGHFFPQVTDRTNPMNDIFKMSVQIPISASDEDRWSNNLKINNALLELRHNGGGPVLINIETSFSRDFSVKELPQVRVIRRCNMYDSMPEIKSKKVAIFVGSHSVFDEKTTTEIEEFCENNNAIVICDHTSNYKGKFRVLAGLLQRQKSYYPECRKIDLIIHIGQVSGAYYGFSGTPTWRVSTDGIVRDFFKNLSFVFEMDEYCFFKKYNESYGRGDNNTLYSEWKNELDFLSKEMKPLPFSNTWIAQQTAPKLPDNSCIHFGILNSLRMWNLFEIPSTVYGYSNVGGFGIDGNISTVLGASLSDKNKLFFIVLGDLSTFYDLNSLGNRHFGSNVRILVVNNGTGFEMRHRGNRGDVFKDDADILFAASGHFGNMSRNILKHFTSDLGFEYLSAESKEEFLLHLDYFTSSEKHKKPILFEVFVNVDDENKAYDYTMNIHQSAKSTAKNAIKSVIGEKGVNKLKSIKNKMKSK